MNHYFLKNAHKGLGGFIALFLFIAANTTSAQHISHGDDVFDLSPIGKGYQLWDMAEHGDSFRPLEVPEGKPLLDQMNALESKILPVIKGIKELFREVNFSFVDVEPKEQIPTGNTNLKILTYKKIQIAVANPVTNNVQIYRKLFDILGKEVGPRAQSFIFLHEILWIAEKSPLWFQKINKNIILKSIDPKAKNYWANAEEDYSHPSFYVNQDDISTTTENIMSLTGYFMSPSVLDAPAESILRFIVNGVGKVNQNTKFENWHKDAEANGWTKFAVYLIDREGNEPGWVVWFRQNFLDEHPWGDAEKNWDLSNPYQFENRSYKTMRMNYGEKKIYTIKTSALTPMGYIAQQALEKIVEKRERDERKAEDDLRIATNEKERKELTQQALNFLSKSTSPALRSLYKWGTLRIDSAGVDLLTKTVTFVVMHEYPKNQHMILKLLQVQPDGRLYVATNIPTIGYIELFARKLRRGFEKVILEQSYVEKNSRLFDGFVLKFLYIDDDYGLLTSHPIELAPEFVRLD